MPPLLKSHTWPKDFAHPPKSGFDPRMENESYIKYLSRHPTVIPESDDDDSQSGSDSDDESDQDGDEEAEGEEHSNQEGASEAAPAPISQSKDLYSRLLSDPVQAIKVFMTGLDREDEDENLMRGKMTKVVTSFFKKGGEKSGHKTEREPHYIAVFDDRTSSNIDFNSPREVGHNFLTETQLRERLGSPRFSDPGLKDIGMCSTHDPSGASRRLVYFSGLDRPGMHNLALTAPRAHQKAVSDLLYHHIKPRPRLKVDIPFAGFKTYTLQFHAPFYALRPDSKLRRDRASLRAAFTLDCLQPEIESGLKWRLYQAQVSIVVTGISDRIWTAYSVVDDYYERKSEYSVKRYHRDLNRTEGSSALRDPISRRHWLHSVDSVVIWDAREYFLDAVRQWVNKCEYEWDCIVREMEGEHEVRNRRSFQERSRGRGCGRSLKDFSSWNEEMIGNLTYLIDKLSKTIRAWREFQGHDINYFFSDAYASDECLGSDEAHFPSRSDCLDKIERTFYHLSGHLDNLNALKKRMIESDRETVNGQIGLESHKAALQVQVLAILAILFSPLNQVASMFNMQAEILPFGQNQRTFMLSVAVMSILYGVLYLLLFKWNEWIGVAVDIISATINREVPEVPAVKEPPEAIAKPSVSVEQDIAKPAPAVTREPRARGRSSYFSRNIQERELPV